MAEGGRVEAVSTRPGHGQIAYCRRRLAAISPSVRTAKPIRDANILIFYKNQ